MRRPGRLRLAALSAGILAAGAAAAPAGLGAGAASAAAADQASIVITSVTPDIAAPGGQIVVRGEVANPTGSPLTGLWTVQLWSSSTPLSSDAEMSAYLNRTGTNLDTQEPGAQETLPAALAPHSHAQFSISLPVSQVGMASFGVYPLAAQLSLDGGAVAAAHTFVPFWPGGAAAKQIHPLDLAWVWPLIDTPQQAACPALLSNELAGSLAPGGRLDRLLAAGASADGRAAQLTWAIDPALVSTVSQMTKPYAVGGSATCAGAASRPASAAAAGWLSRLRAAVSRQDFFVTPYDDPDVAALAHAGLTQQLAQTFASARTTAQQFFQGQAQRPAPTAGKVGWIAWPPDGVADYGVLEALAGHPNQVQTVILNGSAAARGSQPGGAPVASATMPDGVSAGGVMNVLLSDKILTQIVSKSPGQIPMALSSLTSLPIRGPSLGSPAVQAQASAFAQEQWYLAETAMIASQSPQTGGSVVVAPGQRWSPSGAVAQTLLRYSSAPWLRPTSLAGLASTRTRLRWQAPAHVVSSQELRKSLLRQVQGVAGSIQLVQSILTPPRKDYLQRALAAVESSAWRGGRSGRSQAKALLQRVSTYVSNQTGRVQIAQSGRVTLTGKSGPVPVSIRNGLDTAITVRLSVSGPSGDRVKPPTADIVVAAGAQRTVKVQVQSALPGFSTLQLQLTNSAGVPFGKAAAVTIEATQFGSLALAIIGSALLLFVAAAAVRAIRRGGKPAGAATPPPAAGDQDGYPPDEAGGASEPDTVEAERTHDDHPSKGPDGHASAPGPPGPSGTARRG